ncbi:MAG: helix-turn-helix domain-containing protein [Melioribacteraceae bacterium]|nr:helix-turn-helix domain-containing protein [Melioribacteraceae bacterium]
MQNLMLSTITIDELKEIISESINSILCKNNYLTKVEKNDDELIKIEEVSSLLGVSKVTIYKWKKMGLIPFYRISNKIYFKKNEVIESLKKINQGKNN